ncbi:hypothetical protein [Amycolatopsis sp. WAC 01375]|uniref:hypothetical protein n=1 Tax=Amycolatopsis sp. WAC 01375 TaxID=2203194 RepID=UPI001F31BF1D|nr:hypothetical protein [Amycolatopsis sp. WAC 01375]
MPLHKRWSEESIPAEQRPSWPVLLAEQHGVVNTRQLRAYGHSVADIEANLDAGRWQRVLPRVYAMFTGTLSRPAKIQAALKYGGGHVVLSHRTAAEEWGLLPVIEGPVEITVPYTSSAVSCPPLVIVHRSRALPHIAIRTSPPRTRMTDTIIDLATAQRTPKWRPIPWSTSSVEAKSRWRRWRIACSSGRLSATGPPSGTASRFSAAD